MLINLKLKNFRNFKDFSCVFSKKTTLIFGKNGVGKTNLLEAVYCVLNGGRSFRGLNQFFIKDGEKDSVIEINLEGNDAYIYNLRLELKKNKKLFYINKKRIFKLSDIKYFKPFILILPDEKNIVFSSPNLRRKLFDLSIYAINRDYFSVLSKYFKLTYHRRFLLKSGKSDKYIEREWIKNAVSIMFNRLKYLSDINKVLSKTVSENIKIGYASTIGVVEKLDKTNIRVSLENKLKEVYSKETKNKRIYVGPHLDDFKIFYNNRDSRFFASSGEAKMILSIIKYAQAVLIENIMGVKPIFLIDEYLESFDDKVANILKDYLEYTQVIITSCRKEILDYFKDSEKVYL